MTPRSSQRPASPRPISQRPATGRPDTGRPATDSAITGLSRRRLLAGGGAALVGGFGISGTGCSESDTATVEDPRSLQGTLLGRPLAKPAEVLTDTSNQPFDLVVDTDDRLSLWFFGYSNCPDICPVHLGVLAAALDEITGPATTTQVCFVGVDTRRDTPERLRDYLDGFSKDFIGLTGPDEQLDRVQAALDLPSPTFDEPAADGSYSVGHATQILAFTPDNRCWVVYPFGTRRQTWLRDLPLLAEMSWTGAPQATS